MSAFVPPAFGAFGKTGMFQMYDKDAVENSVRLVSRSLGGVAAEASVVAPVKGGQPRGVMKGNFGVRGALVDVTLHTDASKASSVGVKRKNVLAKQLPGLNLGLSLTSSEKDLSSKPKLGAFTTLSADYSRNNFAATASVLSDEASQYAVSASAAVGFEGFSVGGDVKVVNGAAKSYNAGAEYKYKNYTGALVSDSKFEKLKATILAARLGPKAQYTLGAQAKVDLQAPKSGAPQRELVVALQEQMTPNTTARMAAVVNTGALVAQVDHRLRNPALQLSATLVSAWPQSPYAPFPVSKFGVAVTFGDA